MRWTQKHLDACRMMMTCQSGCQDPADVPGAGPGTWADLKAHGYAEDCETGMPGQMGYRITDAGRAAYEAEMARRGER
jgi:hypothetical protein